VIQADFRRRRAAAATRELLRHASLRSDAEGAALSELGASAEQVNEMLVSAVGDVRSSLVSLTRSRRVAPDSTGPTRCTLVAQVDALARGAEETQLRASLEEKLCSTESAHAAEKEVVAARIRAEEALQARIAAQEAEHAALLQAHKDAEEAAASEKSDLLRAHAATENELQASREHLDDAVALSEARAKQHAAEANCEHAQRQTFGLARCH
jgi:hypothetical protein